MTFFNFFPKGFEQETVPVLAYLLKDCSFVVFSKSKDLVHGRFQDDGINVTIVNHNKDPYTVSYSLKIQLMFEPLNALE